MKWGDRRFRLKAHHCLQLRVYLLRISKEPLVHPSKNAMCKDLATSACMRLSEKDIHINSLVDICWLLGCGPAQHLFHGAQRSGGKVLSGGSHPVKLQGCARHMEDRDPHGLELPAKLGHPGSFGLEY